MNAGYIFRDGGAYSDTAPAGGDFVVFAPGSTGLKQVLQKLVEPPPPDNRLADAASPPAIREKTGLVRKSAGSAKFNTEEVMYTSTDGAFAFRAVVVKA